MPSFMQPKSLQPPLHSSNLPSQCRTLSPSPWYKLSPFESFSLSSIPKAFNSLTKESSLLVLILLDEESVRRKGGRRPEAADAKYDGLKDRLAMVGMFFDGAITDLPFHFFSSTSSWLCRM